jgi:hypothetical protein
VRNLNKPDGRRDYTKDNLGCWSTVAGNHQSAPWYRWERERDGDGRAGSLQMALGRKVEMHIKGGIKH